MKHKVIGTSLLLLVLMLAVAGVAYAGGHTTAQLEKAGWSCVIAGPHGWTHCFPPSTNPTGAAPATMQVKVFEDETGPYLGTELLIRANLYHDQPCPQIGGGPYEGPLDLGGTDYFACHHFHTSSP